MRVTEPVGNYLPLTGGTLTGALSIVADLTTETDGLLRLRPASASGTALAIAFEDKDEAVVALVRASVSGHLILSPKGGQSVFLPYTDVGNATNLKLLGAADALNPLRVLMLHSAMFG